MPTLIGLPHRDEVSDYDNVNIESQSILDLLIGDPPQGDTPNLPAPKRLPFSTTAMTLLAAVQDYAANMGHEVRAMGRSGEFQFRPLDATCDLERDEDWLTFTCLINRRGNSLRPDGPDQPLEADDEIVLEAFSADWFGKFRDTRGEASSLNTQRRVRRRACMATMRSQAATTPSDSRAALGVPPNRRRGSPPFAMALRRWHAATAFPLVRVNPASVR